jgi:hypothetical protein
MRRLICRFAFFASTAVFFAAGLASSQVATCDAAARQPLNLRTFQAVAKAFTSLLSQPESASKFLICLQKQDLGLAETLMLYQRRLRLRADAEVEGAFLHYVINARPATGRRGDRGSAATGA